MHESKGQHIGKAPSLHLFYTSMRLTNACLFQIMPLHVALFPGLPCLQFTLLAEHSHTQPIENWKQGRPGEATTNRLVHWKIALVMCEVYSAHANQLSDFC